MGGVADGPRELFITTARVEPDGVLVAVKDSGPGVAPASLERLFAPFSILSLMVWAWGCRSAVRSSNSWRPVVGDRQPAPWRHLQLHGVHPPGQRIVTNVPPLSFADGASAVTITTQARQYRQSAGPDLGVEIAVSE